MVTHNVDEIQQFLINEHQNPTQSWARLCLQLQRKARQIDAMFLTAHAAMMATPPQYRVANMQLLERGMVAYNADFHDANTADHIYDVARKTPTGVRLTWSNDVRETGQVDMVPIDFYRTNWGDAFQFGSWWLNGVYFGPPEKEPPRAKLGAHYENVLHQLVRIRNQKHRSTLPGHRELAQLLTEDIKTMKDHLHDWSD